MKYINPHEFYLETNGRIIDVDGYYGGQCWDLFAYFTQKYCGRTFSCTYSGYVKDFYYHFKELGLDKYFDLITNRYELQDGDWLIWDKAVSQYCWISNYSHIAMFRKYEKGQEQNIILTQNPNGNPNYVYQMLCDFHGFVGALRPKTNQPKKIQICEPIEENKNVNQVFITCDNTMRCRTSPEIKNDNCIGFFKTGYYNILEEKTTDYHWCKLDSDNWVACLDGYSNYIPFEIKEEKNEIDKSIEEEIKETPVKIIENEQQEKESVLIWLLEIIFKIIRKVLKKKK